MGDGVVNDLAASVLRASLQGTVLLAMVLAARAGLGRLLSPKWRCALWLLVVIRLAWPVSIASSASIFHWIQMPLRGVSPDSWMWRVAQSIVDSQAHGRVPSLVVDLWLAGACVLVVHALFRRVFLGWQLRGSSRTRRWDVWWLLEECRSAAGIRRRVELIESPHLRSPCLSGHFRPRLIVPRPLLGVLNRDELRDVFQHELAHLERRDIALGWLLEAICILHWFNPLVWHVAARLRAEREEACDELALERLAPDHQRAYGATLLKVAETFMKPPPSTSTAGVLSGRDDLQERMRSILQFQPRTRTWVVGFGTWLILAITGLTDPPRQPAAPPGGSPVVDAAVSLTPSPLP